MSEYPGPLLKLFTCQGIHAIDDMSPFYCGAIKVLVIVAFTLFVLHVYQIIIYSKYKDISLVDPRMLIMYISLMASLNLFLHYGMYD